MSGRCTRRCQPSEIGDLLLWFKPNTFAAYQYMLSSTVTRLKDEISTVKTSKSLVTA